MPLSWYPASVLAYSVLEIFTRNWTLEDHSSDGTLAILLQFVLSACALYAILGTLGCAALMGVWLIY